MSHLRQLSHPRAGLVAIAVLVAGCNAGDRLANIGKAPDLTPIENPVQAEGYQPVSLPMPTPQPEIYQANSLWRQGSRTFFKDQRAKTLGDVLTIQVTIEDEASLRNETTRSRSNTESFDANGLFGIENQFDTFFSGAPTGAGLVDLDSDVSNAGRGNVTRNEDIRLDVAAVVTQVLPNGNFVIQGRQEVRVNFEVRELIVAGVVRPQDISPDNTIAHDQIAELRVAYGGRGQLSDVQQPRYGSQVLDIILPF